MHILCVAKEWANGPFFVCAEMMKVSPQLNDMVKTVVEPMGYELVGCEMVSPGRGGSVFRVYIDHENGINLDDCSAVSHQLSGVLDVEEPISGNYNLEVSSPGLDRPLFEAAHFDRYAGSVISIRLTYAANGRKKFKGVLQGRQDNTITMTVDGENIEFDLDQIDKANLVPEF